MNHPAPGGSRASHAGTPQPQLQGEAGGLIAFGFYWENGDKMPGTAREEGEGRREESWLALRHPWDRCAEEVKGQGELPWAGCCVPVFAGSQLTGHCKSAFRMERNRVSFG